MHRIHPKNRPIRAFPPDHPAHATLIAHLECRHTCVGREISFHGQERDAVDQQWYSAVDQRVWRFSSLVYTFVSFELILSEWIDPDYQLNAAQTLAHTAKVLALLAECEIAAQQDNNLPVLEMILKVQRFFRLWESAIHLHLTKDRKPSNTS